eukprot:GHVN01039129.1.p3 GENE.GHVN01039129.1~~GHVN01039129.1.p3  ORF type:complete len:139 (-),score=16.73 GHVN01039129.1:219-635(-)
MLATGFGPGRELLHIAPVRVSDEDSAGLKGSEFWTDNIDVGVKSNFPLRGDGEEASIPSTCLKRSTEAERTETSNLDRQRDDARERRKLRFDGATKPTPLTKQCFKYIAVVGGTRASHSTRHKRTNEPHILHAYRGAA